MLLDKRKSPRIKLQSYSLFFCCIRVDHSFYGIPWRSFPGATLPLIPGADLVLFCLFVFQYLKSQKIHLRGMGCQRDGVTVTLNQCWWQDLVNPNLSLQPGLSLISACSQWVPPPDFLVCKLAQTSLIMSMFSNKHSQHPIETSPMGIKKMRNSKSKNEEGQDVEGEKREIFVTNAVSSQSQSKKVIASSKTHSII